MGNTLLLESTGNIVGGLVIFTRQGAIDRYKALLEEWLRERFSKESTAAVHEAASDMHKLGFSYKEINNIHTQYMKERV